ILAGLGDADDDAGAPAAVAAFQRRTHDLGIAGGVEAVVGAAVGNFADLGDDVLAAHVLGIEEVGHAELPAPFLARRVDVNADNAVGTDQLRALDDVEPDPAQSED